MSRSRAPARSAAATPSPVDTGGFVVTAIIGIVGAVIGGFLGNMLFGIPGVNGFDLRSLLVAIVGSLILLFIYRAATRRNAV